MLLKNTTCLARAHSWYISLTKALHLYIKIRTMVKCDLAIIQTTVYMIRMHTQFMTSVSQPELTLVSRLVNQYLTQTASLHSIS